MADTVTQVISELKEKFERHPVWVWYDSSEKYGNVIDEIEAAMEDRGVNVARYNGSFLELKRRLWEEDNDIDEQWLFYVPKWRDDADWFMDVHRLGRQYRPSATVGDRPASKYLVGKEDRIPDEYANWGQNETQLSRAFFCVLFDTPNHSPRDYLVEYLADPDAYRDTIEEHGQAHEWTHLLEETYGIAAGLDAEEIATELLFGELEHTSPTDRYSRLAADGTREAARFCEYWQKIDTATYLEYAAVVSDDRNLTEEVIASDALEWESNAFRQIDDGLVRLCLNRLLDADYDELPALATDLEPVVERRQNGFWYDEGHAGYWDILEHGLEVLHETGSAIEEIEAEGYDPQTIADRYTEEWWTIDAAYRRYVRSVQDNRRAVDELHGVRDQITASYVSFLRTLNRPVAEGLATDPALGTPQTDFFDAYVEREEGTAVLICDGLRYELARELEQRFESDEETDQQMKFTSAALPSITEVGMATHLPGELSLKLDSDDELVVSVDDTEMSDKGDRKARFADAGFTVADIDDILDDPQSALKEAGTPPRIVYSGTIDKLGESFDDDKAFGQVADHVRDVEDVIQRLRAVGYTRFVVTADHGFLYTEELPNKDKVDSLDGVAFTKRRFAVADADAPVIPGDEIIEFDDEQLQKLGIDAADLRLFFPRSVACFYAAGGNMRYFHGGISMQELVVPCLTVTTVEREDEDAPIEYEVTFPESVSNTIVDVTITARSGQLSFTRTPTLRLTATVDGREVAEPKRVEINQGENETTIRLKSGELDEDATILFEAIDEETRETVATGEATNNIIMREDFEFDIE
ncbi:PglZ domain-containing protein [Natronosalvus halobius]|uniref:PglZ domain-containing protein n=1 Tax=Natronosalvus halobius TaxID=2953746 RepID=UPI0020A1D3C5|nr:PglZ domain-containing protein [Natronosalvus halobius]USZ70523.1 PglZ domain-containing protein [Natronosalvus halobius]